LVCGYHLTILRAFKKKCRGDFLFWALQSKGVQEAFAVAASGITRYGLGQEGIKGLSLHLPDLATQKQIADFLDTETARIDALIGKKQRFSDILMANRSDAVLRAFEKFNAPTMQITPETYATGKRVDGWSVRRIKHIISFMTSGSRGWSDLIADEGELFLQSGNIGRSMEIVLDTAQRIQPQTGAEAKRTRLQPKDVLVCITGGRTGAVGYLEQIAEPAYINQHVCLLRTRPALMEPKLLAHVLYSRIGQKQLDFFQYGLKQGLGFSQVGEVRLPVPPRELQPEILREIDQALSRIDRLLDRQSASITRLREYRASLITAAVTGQIDVAENAQPVAAKLPLHAEVVPLHITPQPLTQPDRRTVRVLVAAEVVHRLGAQPSLGRIKLQKLMYLAEAHANINDIDGSYERYCAGPYDGAMMPEIETGLRQEQIYDAKEDTTADRGRITFRRMPRAGGHHDALSAALGDKVAGLRNMIDLFKDMNTEATEAVTTLYAVWNDAQIDGQQPDDAAIIRGFLQDWHADKGRFKEADLFNWLGWMRRNSIVPRGAGPRTISTSTPSLFESE
jgi:type I restriction enzyme S subunit